MYLKSIVVKNAGPIEDLSIELPFKEGNPKPVVLVGRNGSGKSTLLSFIVNALLGIKQRVYENSEIEEGKSYRLRSSHGIRDEAHYYHAQVSLDGDIEFNEWQLDRTKSEFEEAVEKIDHPSWGRVPADETSAFDLQLGSLLVTNKLTAKFNEGVLLFFPSDRFEPPDWLNEENLTGELRFPDAVRVKGRTARRLIARNRLKPTLDWLAAIVLDMLVAEYQAVTLPVGLAQQTINVPARIAIPGGTTHLFNAATDILRQILCEKPEETVTLNLGGRQSRIMSAVVMNGKDRVRQVKNLIGLSAGESALLCMFTAILQDADLAGVQFTSTKELIGLVLIDEADLHLHVNLQHKVLPKLMALFPKVQFVITAHSPVFVQGMSELLGEDGLTVLELPSGREISSEAFSEFAEAFDVFSRTQRYQQQLLEQVSAAAKPVLLVEGKTDAQLIETAWDKLAKGDRPFDLVACGIEPLPENRSGGAEMLRRCLEFLTIASDRSIVGLFDNDRIGNEQFGGVNRKAFNEGPDLSLKSHKTKKAHAMLLPVCAGRELFVTTSDKSQRYLSIEHYFTDAILVANNLRGPSILGTEVFEIEGDKVVFAQKAASLDATEFKQFEVIFAKLLPLFT